MPDSTIANLSSGAPAQATDVLPIQRGGSNFKLAVSDVNALVTATGTAGGDLSGSYPNPTVARVNGASLPASKTIVGTNGSSQIIDATSATLSNNTTGTAANLSGTPALPNGTTATTQTQADGSTKLATTNYVDTGLAAKQTTLTGTGLARNTGASTELSGDVTTSGSNVTTLKNTGSAGTYTKITTDAQGRVSSGATASAADLSNGTTGSGAVVLATSPVLTTPSRVATSSAFSNDLQLATNAYADNNFKGVSVTGFRDDFFYFAFLGAPTTAGTNVQSDSGSVNIIATGATGATSGANSPSTFANPGQINLVPSATSGHGVSISKNTINLGALGSNAGWEFNVILKLASTSTICMRAGLMTSNNADPSTDGMWVEYDTANGSSNASFTWRTVSSSSSNYSTTNSISADTSFHHFRIRSTVIGTILFSVDGGTETAITTDVTTVGLQWVVQCFTRTSATATVVVDFVSYMAATGRT